MQPPELPLKYQIAWAFASLTTSSTAVAATWTKAPEAAMTSPMMCSSITHSSSDLARLICSTFILYYLKFNSSFELNLCINLFRKFYYRQLVLFLETALFAQQHAYKFNDSVISFSLCFFKFKLILMLIIMINCKINFSLNLDLDIEAQNETNAKVCQRLYELRLAKWF